MVWRLLLACLLWSVHCQELEEHPPCCPNDQYIKNEHECINETSNVTAPINMEGCVDRAAIAFEHMEMVLRGQPVTRKNLQDIKIDNYCLGHSENESDKVVIICSSEELFYDDAPWLPYLCFMSVFFLMLTTCIYLLIPRLLDTQGVCIVHLLVGLGLGYGFLASLQVETNYSQAACEILAFFTYGTFMYAFFWLNTLSFHIWRSIVELSWLDMKIKWLFAYHVYAIGGSLLLIFITLLAHVQDLGINPGFGESKCWFRSLYEQFLFFYIPLLILIILNVIFFGWTMYFLWNKNNRNNTAVVFRIKMCLKLFIIMGIPWIFEIISATLIHFGHEEWDKYLIVMKVANGLGGLLIFLILVVFRKRVRRELASRKICGIKFPTHWQNLEDEEADNLVGDHTTVEFHNVTSNNRPNGEF